MINPRDLRESVIEPTLEVLAGFDDRLNTPAAIDLLLGTCAQESDCGYSLAQLSGGPGNGIYQVESPTHIDIKRYLDRPSNQALKEAVESLSIDGSDEDLVGNLFYSTAIARVKYWMIPEAMPETVEGQALYYKTYFNTFAGKATVEKYIENYQRFIL